MKLLCAVLCACVLQATIVESGEILDKLKSGFQKVKQGVHCGAHKVKQVFVEHDHNMDPCDLSGSSDNRIDEDSSPAIDVRGQETTLGPDGRRIIFAGSNCPPGYRSDGAGNCREQY